jgi:redox-sensing transcriptional repressor
VKKEIPRKTVYRLSLYSQLLDRRGSDEGKSISSVDLARLAGVKPTQLRKDLAWCGPIGKRGTGYEITALRKRLDEILGTSSLQPVVLVGAGRMGTALLKFRESFSRRGFQITAAFDSRPAKKNSIAAVPLFPMSSLGRFVHENSIRLAILCVPGFAAQDVCNALVACGIQAILNFAPIVLQTPEQIAVNNINLAVELENLSYFLK